MEQEMNRKSRMKKKKNTGFSLITVIVAIAFIGIMGLLVLYLALNNYRMKITGIQGTDTFYMAEKALEEIRTGLQQDVGDAMSKAYIHVMEGYDQTEDSSEDTLDAQRQQEFEKIYLQELKKTLQKTDEDSTDAVLTGQYSLKHLKNYVELDQTGDFDARVETLVVTNPDGKSPVLAEDSKTGLVLKNLKVIYVDRQGLASIIETDIRLGIPSVQFPTPSTLPDLMNMTVVADGGIVCEGQKGTKNTIRGSIYAGTIDSATEEGLKGQPDTSVWLKDNAALQITAGDKVVTGSEIRVGTSADFSTASGVSLWTGGVRVSSGDVSLLGTSYVADDLTVDKGSQSHVTIQGEYYGYGDPETALSQDCLSSALYHQQKKTDADLSSAMVINGRNTTLDLSKVTKLLLAGRSYVASSAVQGSTANSDILTGDSISVKGSQLAYLLPSQLIRTTDGTKVTNPMDYDTYLTLVAQESKKTKDMVDWTTGVAAWGTRNLSQIGVDAEEPVRTVFYNDNAESAGGYVYFYLNFTDEAKAAAFMQSYYSGDQKKNLDRYLSFYFGENSGVQVRNKDNYLRYVTNGNVLAYDGNSQSGSLKVATDTALTEKLRQEELSLQNSWYALNRKMITSADLLQTDVKDTESGETHNEKDASRSVYDNMVNEAAMVRFLKEKVPADLKYSFTASAEDNAFEAVMYHNGKSSSYKDGTGNVTTVPGKDTPLTVTADMADRLRLIICTGDVRIASGVTFKGILMAKGKLILEPGASLEASPLEAAKVFQSITADTGVSPQSFFWEGDKYVLGNTEISESGDGTGQITDTYALADYVSYENWRKE